MRLSPYLFINLQLYTRCEDTKQNNNFSFIFHNSRLQRLALYLVLLVINQCENHIFIYRFPYTIKKIPISSITRLIAVSFDWTLAVYHCLIGPYTLLFSCSFISKHKHSTNLLTVLLRYIFPNPIFCLLFSPKYWNSLLC